MAKGPRLKDVLKFEKAKKAYNSEQSLKKEQKFKELETNQPIVVTKDDLLNSGLLNDKKNIIEDIVDQEIKSMENKTLSKKEQRKLAKLQKKKAEELEREENDEDEEEQEIDIENLAVSGDSESDDSEEDDSEDDEDDEDDEEEEEKRKEGEGRNLAKEVDELAELSPMRKQSDLSITLRSPFAMLNSAYSNSIISLPTGVVKRSLTLPVGMKI